MDIANSSFCPSFIHLLHNNQDLIVISIVTVITLLIYLQAPYTVSLLKPRQRAGYVCIHVGYIVPDMQEKNSNHKAYAWKKK